MMNAEFKNLKEIIKTATKDDVIWHELYLFLHLTERQAKELIPIVAQLPYFTTSEDGNDIYYGALHFHPNA